MFKLLNTFKLKNIKHTTQATPQNTKCLSVKTKRCQNKTVLHGRVISSSTNAKYHTVQVDILANDLYFQELHAHLFAQNFDARLAGIVIRPDCPLFEKSPGEAQINTNQQQ